MSKKKSEGVKKKPEAHGKLPILLRRIINDLSFQIYHGAWALVIFGVFLYVFVNFWLSQSVSSLYFKFVNVDRLATVSFLQDIRTLPEYVLVLGIQERVFNTSLKDEVYAEELSRKHTILELETLLKLHPQNRDVLVGLAKVYDAAGEMAKATYYLHQARAVDPEAKINDQ